MAEGGAAKDDSTQSSSSPMASLGIRAVIVGATGAIGECLLGELIASKNFASIVVLGRREAQAPSSYDVDQKAEQESGRLKQQIIDFEKLSNDTVGEHFKDKDVFFCTLGTTRKVAGSAEAFRHIDYDYVVNSAQVAKDSGVQFVSYVSSWGAKANSWMLYPQVKGQVEDALKGLKFQSTSIYRPGLLDRGAKARTVEKIAAWVTSSIQVGTVAKAMRIEAEQYFSKKQQAAADENKEEQNLFSNAEIKALCTHT
ncbi:hypothetical protein QZH41_016374 [Actinostola sp. cb2023]|nr:hypothetical protein QZH41_016374 [Actinostola sp. cb2023]